jgi:acylphosphatase
MSTNEPVEQRQLIYAGRVQGVGFRATTAHIARHYAVTGYVKNLYDGRVELVAEGTAAALDDFLGAVARELARYITHVDQQTSPATERYSSFTIDY